MEGDVRDEAEELSRSASPSGGAAPEGDVLIGAAMEGLRRAAHEVEEERHLAATLQRSLLRERLPGVPGLRTAARYLPGSSEAEIGGDWYDLFPLRDGRVGLAIGDVVGKGIAAAARMAHLQSAVRAYALEGLRPSLVLERTNAFALELEGGVMATVLFGILDADAGTLRFASAGHLPPLVIAPNKDAKYVEGPAGSPVGAVGLAAYHESVAPIAPGSTILLYTDGLVERSNLGLDEGLERLRSAVAGASAEPEELCGSLPEQVLGGPPSDDTALLAVLVEKLAGERLALTLPAESASLAPARRLLARWLHAGGAKDPEVYEILVAAGEACANAIAHAYPAREATFDIEASCDGSLLEIRVIDTGRWRLSRGELRRRGLTLMESLMDELVIDKGEDGTTVTLRRRLGRERDGSRAGAAMEDRR
jgi:anti-sigma regulatory factor (Ser/Thr protein kinase)